MTYLKSNRNREVVAVKVRMERKVKGDKVTIRHLVPAIVVPTRTVSPKTHWMNTTGTGRLVSLRKRRTG